MIDKKKLEDIVKKIEENLILEPQKDEFYQCSPFGRGGYKKIDYIKEIIQTYEQIRKGK